MAVATPPADGIPALDELPNPGKDGTTRRWMWLWIALATVAVGVVIGLLFPVSGALWSIDDALDEASQAVAGVRGDVDPLPAYIERINTNLTKVDDAVKPLPHEAAQVAQNLDSVEGDLVTTRRSLTGTSGLLTSTANELVDVDRTLAGTNDTLVATNHTLGHTNGTLQSTERTLLSVSGTLGDIVGRLTSIRGLAGHIHHRLVLADVVRSEGAGAIWRHVRFLNGGIFVKSQPPNQKGLRRVEQVASQVSPELVRVNGHLRSICASLPLKLIAGITPPKILAAPPCGS